MSYRIAKGALERKVVEAYEATAVQTSKKLDFLYRSYDQLFMTMMVDKELVGTVTGMLTAPVDSYEYASYAENVDSLLQNYMYADPNITSLELLTMEGSLVPTKSGLLKNRSYAADGWLQSIVSQDGQSV
ncbi:hypothetical protein FHS18_000358 [Paenibacillus phyllosphaerae]|uniref:Uncharacterized protein n=1 Tax=Paenibacillus phyllosphaerae TaxID=274593 RepID=A0A7W5AT66_9BACL|nr:hypothetical protein [Paenibacillus phyllosphaerae]MBB3108330.1 hypothetical protein [Paenibacillus phyllosphaerae]